jgi:hypothetical protein
MASISTLPLLQNADQTVQVDVFQPGTPPPGVPFDLTSLQVDFYIKRSQDTLDSDPSTVKLSTLTGEIALSTPPGGSVLCRVTVTIARAKVPAALPNGFWRCDVVGGTLGNKVPCGFGPAPVTAQ